jgi:ankyrin repeat protein
MKKILLQLVSTGIPVVMLGLMAGCGEQSSDPPLLLAAGYGTLKDVEAMIATGADVNVTTQTGDTPLCAASRNGKTETVSYLLAHGAQLNPAKSNSYSPLCWAVTCDQKEVVKLLLDKGADVKVVSTDGQLVTQAKSVEVLELLLNRGAPMNAPGDRRSPLHAAAYDGRLEVAKALLAHGADANGTNSWGARPLHEAARSEEPSAAMTELLISKGANVNGLDANRGTPLHMAVMGFTGCMDGMIPPWTKSRIRKDRLKVAEVLLAHGADLNATNAQGQTPLAWALAEQNSAATAFLKARGAK